jgi:Flp pilus assembly protein TadG
MTPSVTHPDGRRGQSLVLFTLVLVAVIAMTGLVLDGGSTFAQRRDMQNAADVSAMAGGYAYLNGMSATSAATQTAGANGYLDGTDGTRVVVSLGTSTAGATTVTVTVSKPHRNYFSGVVGMPTWGVSTTATSEAGGPNAAVGAMPLIFNQDAFDGSQTGDRSYDEPGTGTEDVPQGPSQFNWTVFCTHTGNPCNADTTDVDDLINGQVDSTVIVTLKMDIGPLNAGSHTALFSSLADYVGSEFPVAIVDNDGALVGWAYFHLTGSAGGSTKKIRGYFVSPVNAEDLRIVPGGGDGSTEFGAYSVRLIN